MSGMILRVSIWSILVVAPGGGILNPLDILVPGAGINLPFDVKIFDPSGVGADFDD